MFKNESVYYPTVSQHILQEHPICAKVCAHASRARGSRGGTVDGIAVDKFFASYGAYYTDNTVIPASARVLLPSHRSPLQQNQPLHPWWKGRYQTFRRIFQPIQQNRLRGQPPRTQTCLPSPLCLPDDDEDREGNRTASSCKRFTTGRVY